jgi:hypothetical protein
MAEIYARSGLCVNTIRALSFVRGDRQANDCLIVLELRAANTRRRILFRSDLDHARLTKSMRDSPLNRTARSERTRT